MTRLLACADLHIGAGHGHRRDPLADQAAMLDAIVETALERQVDGVLIAGDVFDRPKPTPPELHAFSVFVAALYNQGIPAVAIHGNAGHDLVNGDEPSALELFQWKPRFDVARHPRVFDVGGVRVGCLPSTPVHRLVAVTGCTREEANACAADLLVKMAAVMREKIGERPCVLLAHWAVTGASLPNGLPVEQLHEPVIDLAALEAQGWDAIVLGHIHNPQILSGNSRFYCGSPMCLDFGEANVPHGVWILHSDVTHAYSADPWAAELVPIPGRRFITADVDLTDDAEEIERESLDVTRYIEGAVYEDVTDAVVRVRVRATEDQWKRVDTVELHGYLHEAHTVRVIPEIVRAQRARVEHVDDGLAPADLVGMWADAQALDQPQRDATLALLDTYLAAALILVAVVFFALAGAGLWDGP